MSPIVLAYTKEEWETRFGYALLKIERAEKHVVDLEQRITQASNAYSATQTFDPKSGQQILHYKTDDRTVKRDLALILGDALHNFRCALDIAWIAILELRFPDAVNSHNKFTIFNDATHLEGTLKSRKIDPGTPLFEFLVGYVKPYRCGGNAELVALHDLDINDKHFALIPTLSVARIQGVKFKDGRGRGGETSIMQFGAPLRSQFDVPLGYKAESYGKVILGVSFGQGTPLENTEVLPTLVGIRNIVFEIVSMFRGL